MPPQADDERRRNERLLARHAGLSVSVVFGTPVECARPCGSITRSRHPVSLCSLPATSTEGNEMVLIEAFKRVVFERYADFNRRAGRAEFWWFCYSVPSGQSRT